MSDSVNPQPAPPMPAPTRDSPERIEATGPTVDTGEMKRESARHGGEERAPAAAGFLGMQARIFFTVVLLAVIFLALIIWFAVTR